MRVVFTSFARDQFLAAIQYIRRDNPQAAKDFRRKIEKALGRLGQYPQSGRPLPEFPDFPHREVIVRPYRFFYLIKDKTVMIIAVWRSAQLPENPTRIRLEPP